MEYGPENNIFVLKVMMKSGLEMIILKIPPCAKPFLENLFYFIARGIFASNCKFSNKNDLLCAWRDFNKTFCGISTLGVSPSLVSRYCEGYSFCLNRADPGQLQFGL